jgi:glucosamine--fructose-6-phosphate aminotransferase (isomerizing)
MGVSIHAEILEQPGVIRALLEAQRGAAERIAAEVRGRGIEYVFLAARGTSDNAGRYANYLLGAHNRLPLALATPSLFSCYKRAPRLKRALVIGVSQSGQSPDIVSVLEEGRRQGCATVAITNEPRSPLAQASEFLLDIRAGPEKAVAATKTYTAELTAIAMLSLAMQGQAANWGDLRKVPAWMKTVLRQEGMIERAAQRYRYMEQTVVLGRGFNYCTAFEWALKLKEMAYVKAEPYSPADFQHGPIAMLDRGFPVLAIAPRGKVLRSMLEQLKELRQALDAELVVISNERRGLSLAKLALSIPGDIPEWLTPLVSILPAQLFAYHLTLAKGLDAERPRGIRKVTETR